MIFLFFVCSAFVANFAFAKSLIETEKSLWVKLQRYQLVSGISEDTKLSIWRRSGNNTACETQGEFFFNDVMLLFLLEGLPKFRYVTRQKWPQGNVNPINFEEMQKKCPRK